MIWPRQPLLVLGLSAWFGGAAGWWLFATGAQGALAAVLGLLVGAGPVIVLRRPSARIAGVLLAAGLLAGAAAAGGHLAASRPEFLRAWSQEGQTVQAVARVGAVSVRHPVEIGSAATVRVAATLRSVAVAGEARAVSSSVVLTGPADVLGHPDRGAVLAVSGQLLAERPLREPGFGLAVDEVAAVAAPRGWSGLVAQTRRALWQAMGVIDADAGSLVAGLAIGDDSRQREQLALAMRDSGLSHLTAVSGGNIAVVAGLVLGAAALLGASLHARVACGGVAVLAYAAFVGPEPSVLRAAVMGSVALVGLLRGGRGGGFGLLGLAVFVLVVARPGLVLSWGFALSVAATAGILALGPPLERSMAAPAAAGRGRLVAAAVAVTLGAQVATAPLLAAMTGALPLASIPANLAAGPLVMPITVLGLAITLISPLSPDAGRLIAQLAEPFGSLLAAIAEGCAAQSWASVSVPSGALGAGLVAGCCVAVAIAWRWYGVRRAAAGALAAAIVVVAAGRPAAPPADWAAAACDVGQGDAFLIRAGPASAVLIDTGPDVGSLLACLRRMGVSQVPLLVLTHFDTDHVAATGAVLERFGPRSVLISPVRLPEENADAVLAAAARTGTAVAAARPGQRLTVGRAVLSVVWPRRIIRSGSVGNNAAVAIAAEAEGVRMLFTGDLEPPGQAGLMLSQPAGGFDVTTIPHHGSANQDPRFLGWTGASVAWVSAGEGNRFGHPRQEALDLADAAGMAVGRTDRDGTLVLVIRGGRPAVVPLDAP